MSGIRDALGPYPLRLFLALLAIASLASPGGAAAQGADIVMHAEINPNGILPPGSVGGIVVTVRNDGPAPAGNVIVVSSLFPIDELSLFPVAGTAPCGYGFDVISPQPGNPPRGSIDLSIGAMAVGQVVTCQLGIASSPHARNPIQLNLRSVDVLSTDPSPSNNAVGFSITFVAQPVPAISGNPSIVVGLMFLVGLIGARHARTYRDLAVVGRLGGSARALHGGSVRRSSDRRWP